MPEEKENKKKRQGWLIVGMYFISQEFQEYEEKKAQKYT